MAKEIDVLKSQANQIKNEVEDGKNTATRIGGMFVDLVDKVEATRSDATNDALKVVNPQIKETEQKVGDLALKITAPLSHSNDVVGMIDTAGTWSKNNKHIAIAVKKGDKVHAEKNASQSSFYSLFATYNKDEVSKSTLASGYVGAVSFNTLDLVIPDGVGYIYFLSETNGTDRLPSVVTINDVSQTLNLNDRVSELEGRIKDAKQDVQKESENRSKDIESLDKKIELKETQLNAAIGAVSKNINTPVSHDFDINGQVDGNGTWSSSNKHIILNVSAGDVVTLKKNIADTSFYAILSNYDQNTLSNSTFADGYSGAKSFDNITFVVPSNGNFMYLLSKTGDRDRLPSSVVINGVDITDTLKVQIFTLQENIYEEESKRNAANAELKEEILEVANDVFASVSHTFDVDGMMDGSGVWSKNNKHIILKVEPNDVVDIDRSESNTTYYCVLATYDKEEPSKSKLASGYTGALVVSSAQTFAIPEDGRYLYLLSETSGNNRLPKYLAINGIDKTRSLPENVKDNKDASIKLAEGLSFVTKESYGKEELEQGYIANTNIGEDTSLTPLQSPSWKHKVIDCKENDKFVIVGIGGGTPRLWAFLDEENKTLSRSDASLNAIDGCYVIAPKGSAKLVVNNHSNCKEPKIFSFGYISEALQNEALVAQNDIDKDRFIVFFDDFDTFNEEVWEKWDDRVGFSSEQTGYYSADNVYVEDSCLVIKSECVNTIFNGKTYKWKTGRIDSSHDIQNNPTHGLSFRACKVEFRAKIKYGQGSDVGIWSTGQYGKWPDSHEYDFLEIYHGTPIANHHYAVNGVDTASRIDYGINSKDDINKWNIYGYEWDAHTIRVTLNGRLIKEIEREKAEADHPLALFPQYFIIGAAWGGNCGDPIENDPETYYLYLDWIKVYGERNCKDLLIEEVRKEYPITDFKFSHSAMNVGDKFIAVPECVPSYATNQSGTEITIENSTIVARESGYFIAKKAGTTNITFKNERLNITRTFQIVVS